jgi:hypothetical protein
MHDRGSTDNDDDHDDGAAAADASFSSSTAPGEHAFEDGAPTPAPASPLKEASDADRDDSEGRAAAGAIGAGAPRAARRTIAARGEPATRAGAHVGSRARALRAALLAAQQRQLADALAPAAARVLGFSYDDRVATLNHQSPPQPHQQQEAKPRSCAVRTPPPEAAVPSRDDVWRPHAPLPLRCYEPATAARRQALLQYALSPHPRTNALAAAEDVAACVELRLALLCECVRHFDALGSFAGLPERCLTALRWVVVEERGLPWESAGAVPQPVPRSNPRDVRRWCGESIVALLRSTLATVATCGVVVRTAARATFDDAMAVEVDAAATLAAQLLAAAGRFPAGGATKSGGSGEPAASTVNGTRRGASLAAATARDAPAAAAVPAATAPAFADGAAALAALEHCVARVSRAAAETGVLRATVTAAPPLLENALFCSGACGAAERAQAAASRNFVGQFVQQLAGSALRDIAVAQQPPPPTTGVAASPSSPSLSVFYRCLAPAALAHVAWLLRLGAFGVCELLMPLVAQREWTAAGSSSSSGDAAATAAEVESRWARLGADEASIARVAAEMRQRARVAGAASEDGAQPLRVVLAVRDVLSASGGDRGGSDGSSDSVIDDDGGDDDEDDTSAALAWLEVAMDVDRAATLARVMHGEGGGEGGGGFLRQGVPAAVAIPLVLLLDLTARLERLRREQHEPRQSDAAVLAGDGVATAFAGLAAAYAPAYVCARLCVPLVPPHGRGGGGAASATLSAASASGMPGSVSAVVSDSQAMAALRDSVADDVCAMIETSSGGAGGAGRFSHLACLAHVPRVAADLLLVAGRMVAYSVSARTFLTLARSCPVLVPPLSLSSSDVSSNIESSAAALVRAVTRRISRRVAAAMCGEGSDKTSNTARSAMRERGDDDGRDSDGTESSFSDDDGHDDDCAEASFIVASGGGGAVVAAWDTC